MRGRELKYADRTALRTAGRFALMRGRELKCNHTALLQNLDKFALMRGRELKWQNLCGIDQRKCCSPSCEGGS